jgi:hypothetical protein
MDHAVVRAAVEDPATLVGPGAGDVLLWALLGRHVLIAACAVAAHAAGGPAATADHVAQGLAHGGRALVDVLPVARHAQQKLAAVDSVRRAAEPKAETEQQAERRSKSHEWRKLHQRPDCRAEMCFHCQPFAGMKT